MNNTNIIKLLFITIIILSFMSSVSAALYCTETKEGREEFYCADLEENPTLASIVCEVTSSNAPECEPDKVGCCCDDGGSIEYPNMCSETVDTGIIDTADCQNFCIGRGIKTGDCDDYDKSNVNLILEPVKGSSHVQLRWSSCDPDSIEITRDGSLIASLDSNLRAYRDTATVWITSYDYTVKVNYPGSVSYESTATILTGDEECEGITHNNPFCVRSNDVTTQVSTYGTCNANNIYSYNGACPLGQQCNIEGGTPVCRDVSMCEASNLFLGLSDRSDCYAQGFCYYDRTNTGIDRCFDCDTQMSCFDYKTQGACTDNRCQVTGCSWQPFNQELGTGICKSDTENYCLFASNPEGTINEDAYTPLLTPTTTTGTAKISDFYTTGAVTCTNNAACLLALSCQNYDGNSGACANNECNAATGDGLNGCFYTNSLCTRRNADGSMPCLSLTGESRVLCERDYFAPETSIIARNVSNNYQFTLTITDQTTSNTLPQIIQSPYTEGYTTSICLANTQNGACTTQIINYDRDSPNFDLIYLDTVFPGVMNAEQSYFLVVNSVDPYQNEETGNKRISFTVPEVIDPTPPIGSEYNLSLDSPLGYTIRTDQNYVITVSTTKQSQSCRYAVTDSLEQNPSSYLALNSISGTNTIFSSSSQQRVNSFALFVNCTSTGSESVQRKFWVTAVGENEKISLSNIQFNPDRLMQRINNAWRTNLTVETNIPSRCRYSWTPNTPYANKQSYTEQDANNNRYVTVHNIPITLSDSITSPQNRTAYVVCESSFPNDNPRYTPEKNTTLMIYPNAPSDFWINIISPVSGLTTPATYYNNFTIPYSISTAMPSTCTATVSDISINLQAGIRTNWNGTFNVDESGPYNMKVNCIYSFESQQRQGSSNRVFFVDASRPFVSVRIGSNESTTPKLEDTFGFNFTTTYNDSESGIASANYTVIRKSATVPSQEVIYSTGNLPLQNVQDFNRTILGPLLDNHGYTVNVTVRDKAGNLQSRLSNQVAVELPDMCKDGYQNGDESDTDCGGPDCSRCTAGRTCNANTDCVTGLLCLEGNDGRVCAPAHCNDGRQNNNETDIDCGPVCYKDCLEHIRLVKPQFGYTPTSTFSIEISTYENSVCNYRNSNVPAGSYIPITTQNTKTHTISNYQISAGDTKDEITIICESTQGITRERNFTLNLDPNRPIINTVSAVPNPVTIKSFNVAEGKTAYWTILGAIVNKDAFCKYSFTSKPYSQMEYTLGKGVSENKSSDYKQTNTVSVGLDKQDTYNIFVACKGLNNLISEPKGITVIANEDTSIVPLIISPPKGSTLNSKSVNVTVNPVYDATSCSVRIGSSEITTPLTSSGSSFTGTLTITSEGTQTINATCTYPTSPFVTRGSAISYFIVDTISPNMTKNEAKDPFTRNMTVSFHRTAVRVDVGAIDANSGVTRFYYTVLVNNRNVSSGSKSVTKTDNASLTFYDNNLNLNDDDVVSVRVSARDSAGNNGTVRNSNNLLYTEIPIPPTCNDGVQNGNETDVDCGGNCPACPSDFECLTPADCEGGYTCEDNVCVPELEVCRDEECGGDCPACGIGGDCNDGDDCKEGLFCSEETGKCELDIDYICSNTQFERAYESDVDCGGVCALQLNLTCSAGESCRQQTDCSNGLTCTNGVCTEAKTKPPYCYENAHNNSMNTSNGTLFCGHNCDERCPAGLGCLLDWDCVSGLRCEKNVCTVPTNPDSCNPSDALSICGGTCPDPCRLGGTCGENDDCASGLVCSNGKCARSSNDDNTTVIKSNPGELGHPCLETGKCFDDLRCNEDFVCEEKTGVSWVRIMLFIILIALLVAIGYYAYVTYYQPSAKPDFLKTKEEKERELKARQKTAVKGFPLEPLKVEGNTHTVQPPSAPFVPESPKVDALLEKKRKENKKEEISKLFGEFDNSALDDETDKDKKAVKNVLKNVPKADFDEKPLVPVRAQSSAKTFKNILDEAKKEVASEEKKKISKMETKTKKEDSKKTDSTKKETKSEDKKKA